MYSSKIQSPQVDNYICRLGDWRAALISDTPRSCSFEEPTLELWEGKIAAE